MGPKHEEASSPRVTSALDDCSRLLENVIGLRATQVKRLATDRLRPESSSPNPDDTACRISGDESIVGYVPGSHWGYI